MGLLRKVSESTPHPLRELNPEVPLWLEAIVNRLMQKSPESRFSSAEEVAVILESELAHLHNPTAVAVPARQWMSKPRRFSLLSTNPRSIPVAILLSIIGAIALFLSQLAFNAQPNNADDADKVKAKQEEAQVVSRVAG
jgi:hypothetical protein